MAKWLHDIQTPYCLYDYIHYQHSVDYQRRNKMASFRRAPAAAPKYFVIPNFPPAQMAKQNGLLKYHYRLPELLSAQSTDYD
jgi:hypothetical protein